MHKELNTKYYLDCGLKSLKCSSCVQHTYNKMYVLFVWDKAHFMWKKDKREVDAVREGKNSPQHPGAIINRGWSRFPSSSDPAPGLPASTQRTHHWLLSNPLEPENRASAAIHLICREPCLTLTAPLLAVTIKSGHLKLHTYVLSHIST